jgi:hypothetical protein
MNIVEAADPHPNPSPKGRGEFTLSLWERVPSAKPRAGEGKPPQ